MIPIFAMIFELLYSYIMTNSAGLDFFIRLLTYISSKQKLLMWNNLL